MYIHSNLNVHTGRLQWIINGPEMHRWHHAMGKGMGSNFSTKLAIWDWIFGTAYLPANQMATDYGIRSWFPKTYFAQTLYAFRPLHRHLSPTASAAGFTVDSDRAAARDF